MTVPERRMPAYFACIAILLGTRIFSTADFAAAAYPERPVHMVTGALAGGPSDEVARLMAQALSEKWNQPVVVINRPGADDSLATDTVARAEPDGYNLAWISRAHTAAVNDFKLDYDPVRSFAPITQIGETPDILIVHPSFPADSVKELIAFVKSRPGQLNFAMTARHSSPSYLETALLMKLAGIKAVGVGYKGGADAMRAVLDGEAQICFAPMPTVMEQVKSGRLKALAVSTQKRSPMLPDLPTIAEAAGFNEFEGGDWLGVLAPAGTPKGILGRVHQDLIAVLREPDVQNHLHNLGWAAIGSSPDEFAEIIDEDVARWANLLRTIEAN